MGAFGANFYGLFGQIPKAVRVIYVALRYTFGVRR